MRISTIIGCSSRHRRWSIFVGVAQFGLQGHPLSSQHLGDPFSLAPAGAIEHRSRRLLQRAGCQHVVQPAGHRRLTFGCGAGIYGVRRRTNYCFYYSRLAVEFTFSAPEVPLGQTHDQTLRGGDTRPAQIAVEWPAGRLHAADSAPPPATHTADSTSVVCDELFST